VAVHDAVTVTDSGRAHQVEDGHEPGPAQPLENRGASTPSAGGFWYADPAERPQLHPTRQQGDHGEDEGDGEQDEQDPRWRRERRLRWAPEDQGLSG
jgi:hypothetical protein